MGYYKNMQLAATEEGNHLPAWMKSQPGPGRQSLVDAGNRCLARANGKLPGDGVSSDNWRKLAENYFQRAQQATH